MTPAPVAAPIAPPIRSTRILVSTLGSAVMVFGIVVYLEIPGSDYPPLWVPLMLGALAVFSHLLSRTLGFRVKPIPSGTPPSDAMPAALAAFQASLILRFALTESVAIIALVLSFVVATWMTYLIGGVLALILFAVNVWPSTALISKVQQQLDREGGQSHLTEALFGITPGTTASAVAGS